MYLNFYGLREEPFRQVPDPRFLHLAEPHRAALLAMIDAVVRRRGFMVLTGPVGTGKTTILHAALRLFSQKFSGERKVHSALLVNPTLNRDEFLESVLDELEIGCASTSKPRRLLALQQFLRETRLRRGTTVLIVDEAHLLSPELLEEIRLLGNSDDYGEKLLQMILCGQPELLDQLRDSKLLALRQRIALYRELRLLNPAEIHDYIRERLHAAGLRGPSPFSAEVIEEIYHSSRGVPRLINMICDQSLSLGSEWRTSQISVDIVQEVSAALSLTRSAHVNSNELSPELPAMGSVADILSDAFRQQVTNRGSD